MRGVRVNKVGRVCSTPGCGCLAMLDRPQCLRCKQARSMASRLRYFRSQKCLERRRVWTKTRPTRAEWLDAARRKRGEQ